ncbi:MAG: spore cortex biosynthesis protein YabQ [Clostridia bacterium]|nr:spore cortex biosynthesis protein YabQ [Clostridia bacterium]
MINNQAYLFFIFSLDGFIIGLLFDFFRILRKCFKTANLVTYIEDILFWILTGFLVLYTIFIFNNGEIRFFMFIGIIIGIALYILLLSKYIITINVFIINIFKNLTKSTKNVLKNLRKIGDFRKKNRIL